MKILLLRLFKLAIMSLGFPIMLLSLFIAVALIPLSILVDCFYYLFTGSFYVADLYISVYFHEVAFRLYFQLENILNKIF